MNPFYYDENNITKDLADQSVPAHETVWSGLGHFFSGLVNFLKHLFSILLSPNSVAVYYDIFIAFGLFFIVMIVYCTVRMLEIRKREHEHLHYEIHEFALKQAERDKRRGIGGEKNERWENVMKYLNSENEGEWKLAIIEADTLLDDLTYSLGLPGENIGERLKATNREKFKTLEDAWEAHIVRNKIAHEGSKFELPKREAQRIAYLYERVFREFGVI